MSIYEIATDGIKPITTITFDQAGLRERTDLQHLLRERIDVVAPDTMVLAERCGSGSQAGAGAVGVGYGYN
jgi:hypothetical protein